MPAANKIMPMDIESMLLAALSMVTSGLIWAVKALYGRLLKAEATVEGLRQELEKLERENGSSSAKVAMYERCHRRQDCPFHAVPASPHAPQ